MGSISKIKDLDFEFLFFRIFALIQLLWLWTVSAFSSSCSQDSLSLACAFSRLSFSPFLSPGSCFPFHFQIQSCFTFCLFPWFCELSPSCLHLSANRLPNSFPLVTSLEPLTVSSMVPDPYSERARAYPTPYMLTTIPLHTCTTSSWLIHLSVDI